MHHRAPPPDLEWRSGSVPVSARFGDPYYSLDDGLEETRHVFLAGNDLPARFTPGFHIAELGFGTGLNFLAAAAAWKAAGIPGRLIFTSFEAFPLDAETAERALLAFPETAALRKELAEAWAAGALDLPWITLRIIPGDARETLPAWTGRADAWFLDGFSPARNPELWEATLLAEVARHTAPGGSCATYTAAGHVRRALADAGVEIERCPCFGRKRHMTIGRRTP